MGVNVTVEAEVAKRMLASSGICFMMVPMRRSVMRQVGPARVELGTAPPSTCWCPEQPWQWLIGPKTCCQEGSWPPPFQDGVCGATIIKATPPVGAPARPQEAGKREAI